MKNRWVGEAGILSRLLLVLPLHAHEAEGRIHIDMQAHNGLRLWLTNFDEVVLACPVVQHQDIPTLPLDTVTGQERLSFVGLPATWMPHQFAAALMSTSKLLAGEIARADYLHFALGGLWGCWASVASIIAVRQGRHFSVWTDRVESQVAKSAAQHKRGFKKIYYFTNSKLMHHYERAIIRRASIGLFHGADCYEAYSKSCQNAHLVHDIHITPSQHICAEDLETRLQQRGGTLRIAYAGRAANEKGILEWVRAVSTAYRNGSDVNATWYGTGPELKAAENLAKQLHAPVSFPGSLPHEQVLATLKKFDLFVFCHKTLESPRCLIEALACGLPICGFSSPYPADLVSQHQGGVLVRQESVDELASAISLLSRDPTELAKVSRAARLDGQRFSDESVFRHRSDLIKSMGSPPSPKREGKFRFQS